MKLTKKLVSCLIAALIIAGTMFCVNGAVYVVDDYGNVYINRSDSVTYAGYQGTVSDVSIPSVYDNKPVSDIADFALKDNTVMDHLSFEFAGNLQSVGDYAFMGCNKISSVYLEKKDVKFGCGVFRECTGLIYSEFFANNDVVPQELYYGCSNLEGVKLSASLKKIEKHAFCYCPKLKYLEIPASVESIDSCAFEGDESLTLGVHYKTYGMQYAIDNNIAFDVLDAPKLGDVNGDGVVDILDATEIQKYAAESTDFTDEQFELGDINKDGYCDVIDALLVQKSVIGAYELPQNIIRY